MRDHYAEFLQTKISVNTLHSEVPKVPKVQIFVKKNHTFGTFGTTLPGVYQKKTFKNNSDLAEFKTEKFHEILNRFIENGITFDVSADDFQVIDNNQILKTSDKQFLELNDAAILCQLQQSLLMKHLFSHSPEQFEDFAFEIRERESIMTEVAETTYERYCTAVKDVTRNWFEHLMNKQTF